MSEEFEKQKRREDAAKRALAEANERRNKTKAQNAKSPKEFQGRDGLDPARFGDWEKDGIASDF